jgi:hypothetical protein
MGLSTVSFTAKTWLGAWCWNKSASYFRLDQQGQVLHVLEDNGRLSVTNLDGKTPAEIENTPLDSHSMRELAAPRAQGPDPRTQSYRNSNRHLVKYGNDSQVGNEIWWFVPAKGRLYGYDKGSYRSVGSYGPDGFTGPGQEGSERFPG